MFSMDSERGARLLLFGAVGLIVAISAAFIGFGYWYTEIRAEQRTVLKVDDVNVSFAAMKRRMAYELSLNANYYQSPTLLPEIAYVNLLNELTVVHHAAELGISVTTEELDARLRQRIGVPEGADQRTFANSFREELDKARLSEAEYRRVVEATILVERIRAQYSEQAPSSVEQVQIEAISTADLEAAEQARERVVAGEAWAVVAREVSTDEDVQETGGLQAYALEGSLNQAFEDFAFEAPSGEISEPLSIIDGQPPFYVIRVVDRSEQPLSEEQKPAYAAREYEKWLEQTQMGMSIDVRWQEADKNEALNDVFRAHPQAAQPQQPQQQPPVIATAAAVPPTAATAVTGEEPGSSGAEGSDDSGPDPSGAPQPDGQ
jgi:parvulin-like peptidyl-prolyl isomerase